MSRTLCLTCERPPKACICDFIAKVSNEVPVVVLQHPSEVGKMKGTASLLALSLESCDVLVTDNVDQLVAFDSYQKDHQLVLLYPSEQAIELSATTITELTAINQGNDTTSESFKKLTLVILDGTWKKAYRMFMLSTKLQALPQICLPHSIACSGNYLIRKVAKKNAMSSLEATCYALAMLEASDKIAEISPGFAGKYQTLLSKFEQFNQFQLSFRPDYLAPRSARPKES